mgnify:CR=1 FL=1
MTLTDLRYIVALARERHFGRAAERCHVSQPTLSVAVKKLEEELGVTLFERNAADVRITPIGEQIVEQASQVLNQAAQIREIAQQGRDPLSGPLRLGVIYTIGPYLLPRLIPILRERAPNMPLVIRENFTSRLAEMLKRSELDVIIIAHPFAEQGVVTQPLLDALREGCRERGIWLSVDPKPVHRLDLRKLSLLTPNRKEAFELAGPHDGTRASHPLADPGLAQVATKLLAETQPALLLITLGEQGMLLCQRGQPPFHIPTVAREVFEVSGAGDTVIASFTLAIAAGASPVEAAVFSNHAAGVVVGKLGTATVCPDELRDSFRRER